MTTTEFKIWLISYGYTVKSLAAELQITPATITRYNGYGRYPRMFLLALKGIEALHDKSAAE